MLDGLSEFETYRGVVKDAQELLKQHEQTMKQTAEAAAKPEMMGKPLDALTPEQKAELGNLASRQSQVGKGLQNLLERMGEMAGRLDESDPLASSAMREAAEKSQKQGTAGKLGEAADQLEKNQMGQARSRQEQARDELQRPGRRDPEPPRARACPAGQGAQERRGRAGEDPRTGRPRTCKKTREAQKNPNAKERGEQLKRLAKEQAEIQKDLERQLQRLAKLSADRAARAGQNRQRQDGPRSGQPRRGPGRRGRQGAGGSPGRPRRRPGGARGDAPRGRGATGRRTARPDGRPAQVARRAAGKDRLRNQLV